MYEHFNKDIQMVTRQIKVKTMKQQRNTTKASEISLHIYLKGKI